MSLRGKILLIALTVAAVLVVAFAAIQFSLVVIATLDSAQRVATLAGQQTKAMLLVRLPELWRTVGGDRTAWQAAVASDEVLAAFLRDVIAAAPMLAEISIAGENGRILATSNLSMRDAPLRERESLAGLRALGPLDLVRRLYPRGPDCEVRIPIGSAESARPVFTIQVLVSTALLRDALWPGVRLVIGFSAGALLLAILLVWLLERVVTRNLRHIGEAVDRIQQGELPAGAPIASAPEFRAVESKLSLLGAQVRDFRSRVSNVLERLEEGILLYDADRRLSLAGGAAARLLGLQAYEISQPREPLASFVREAFERRGGVREQVLDWPRAGGTVPLLASADYFADSGSLLVRLRDAEGRKQLESQMGLLARLDAINRLTGGVAHEIKNPLNSIAARLALLETVVEGSEEAEAEIRIIGEEVERLDRVVKTFLDFTRPVELAQQEVDLVGLAREVAEFIEPQAAAQSVVVSFRAASPAAPVWGDADLLRQALVNLVANGIDAMPHGGTLSLEAGISGHECRLVVVDTGVGIPDAQREKIFQLYYTTKKGGSGIGLAMVYRAVQLHGGSIGVESEPGRGTRFELAFPLSAAREKSA